MSPAPERSRARNTRVPHARVARPARSRARHMGSCARHIDKVPRSGESSADDAPTSPRPSPNLFISLMRWALVPLAWLTRVPARRDRAVRAFGPRGRRGDVAAPACSPSPPLGGREGRGEVGVSSPARPMARSWRGRRRAVQRTMVRARVPFPKFVCMLWGRRAVSPTDHSHTPSCPDLFRASPEPGPPDAGQTRGWPERVRP